MGTVKYKERFKKFINQRDKAKMIIFDTSLDDRLKKILKTKYKIYLPRITDIRRRLVNKAYTEILEKFKKGEFKDYENFDNYLGGE